MAIVCCSCVAAVCVAFVVCCSSGHVCVENVLRLGCSWVTSHGGTVAVRLSCVAALCTCVSRMCCSRAARSRANSHHNLLRIPANATRCNTLQHPATLCSTLISKWTMKRREFRSYCESQVHQGLDREELNKQYICTARFFENSRVRI